MSDIKEKLLTYELAHQMFTYVPETGQLLWKRKQSRKIIAGQEAGTFHKQSGYRNIGISFDGKMYLYRTHRIVFFMHHGYWPPLIDHIDQDKLNNRAENLREATKSENALNSTKQGRWPRVRY